eukprot:4488245-Prymnesium_polylepis.2
MPPHTNALHPTALTDKLSLQARAGSCGGLAGTWLGLSACGGSWGGVPGAEEWLYHTPYGQLGRVTGLDPAREAREE